MAKIRVARNGLEIVEEEQVVPGGNYLPIRYKSVCELKEATIRMHLCAADGYLRLPTRQTLHS